MVKERWLVERGPLADPEYLRMVEVHVPGQLDPNMEFVWGALERATLFPDQDTAADVAAETRSEELRVVSDADL